MQITMHVSLKSLFVTSLLALSTQGAHAEWQAVPSSLPQPSNMPQATWISPDMVPITWGDCIPVPVDAVPAMPMPAPMPFFGGVAAPNMNMPAPFPAPPPSPFYGNIPVIPLPPTASSQCAPTIDDGSKAKLGALQKRYDQASEASRNKIEELKQTLSDAQNQLQDSVATVGSLTKSKESCTANINEIKKKMEALSQTSQQMLSLKEKENAELKKHLAKLDNAGNGIQQKMMALSKERDSLQKQLSLATEKSAQQAQKLMAFGQTSTNMNVLKQQLVSMTKKNDGMQSQLKSLLKDSSTKLTAMEKAHGDQAKQNAALKKQIAELNAANKNMQTQIDALKTDSANKSKQLLTFKGSTSQINSLTSKLAALNLSYKNQLTTDGKIKATLKSEISRLKQMQQESQGKYDSLKNQFDKLNGAYNSQLASYQNAEAEQKNCNASYGALTKKMTLAGNSEATLKSEFSKLQQAHTTQLGKNDTLVKQLADLNVSYKSLLAQVDALKADAAVHHKTILGLKEIEETNKTNLENCKNSIDQNNQKLVASLDNVTRLKEELESLKNKLAAQAKERDNNLLLTNKALAKLKSDYAKATADTDKDGVLDKADKCPSTIAGTKVNAMGCADDNDKDGVVDADDKCPSSPFGSHVNAEGCPKVAAVAKVVEAVVPSAPATADADNDGVADGADLCPTSEAGAKVNEFGCKATENITLEGVTFKLGSAKLKSSSLAILDAAANTIKSNPNLKIQIEGHTDNQGWTGANKRLSQTRANAVMIHLIRKGVKAENLSAKGYGESRPITTNDTKAGRAKNRRVDLKIIK